MPISKHSNNANGDRNGSKSPHSQSARQSPSDAPKRRLLGSHQKRVSPLPQSSDQPQYVARSHFGQQHHSMRPSAWVIPFDDNAEFKVLPYNPTAPLTQAFNFDGAETPPVLSDDEGAPLVTPETGRTPCTSNKRKMVGTSGLPSNRKLYNSHRKTKLHYITPIETPQTTATTPTIEHRGNGVVMDLTSLFSPAENNVTTAPTNHQPPSKSPAPLSYNAPTPPPWKTRTAAAQSPANLPSEPSLELNHSMLTETTMKKEDLQWDTKSQTTQQALLTERQCQALTQWLNFVLVGEQTQDDYYAAKKKKATTRRVGGSFDDDDRTQATTPTHGGRSWATTPTQVSMTPTNRGRATPSVRSGRATPGVMSGRATPTIYSRPTTPGGRTTPAPTSQASMTTQIATNKTRHRRLSLFQYADSYEHAQDQAHHWFQHSAQWKELRRRIRMEVSSGKLTLRDDRNLYANIACRDTLLELFCSYKPAWLTLALEVVMDETIPTLPGHTLPTAKHLKQFIVQKVLMDAKLLAKYTHGRGMGTPSGKFEKAFQAELQPIVLYRIMVLVFFLDRAAVKFQAQNATMGNLFVSNSKVKSTAQVLVTICREFLSRQGDIIKQMARANLHVYYKQHPLDEIEYPIVNFAIDLRDGVRLCRVVEILWLLPRRGGNFLNNENSGGGIDMAIKYPLLHQLRIPAISRLQKIHNVNVALAALQEQCQVGLPNDLQAHHIVDGQRRMVMRLVWTIVLIHCFENTDILTRKQVANEIAQAQAMLRHLKVMEKRRRQAQDHHSPLNILERETDAVDSVAMVSTDDKISTNDKSKGQRMLSPMLSLSISQSKSSSYDEDDYDERSDAALLEMPAVQGWKGLLFQWCQEVCTLVEAEEKRGLGVSSGTPTNKKTSPEKWTSNDLANGKTLCCLIHYYHPAILPLDELRLASKMVDGPPLKIQTTADDTLTSKFRHMRHQRRSTNIAPDYYLRLAQRRLNEVGGIPSMMLLPFDKNGKDSQRKKSAVAALGDEKSILVFLYHVCARLLESRHQVQAVVFVQQRYRYLRSVVLFRQKLEAAKFILSTWRANKRNYYRNQRRKYKGAVTIIEDFIYRNFAKLLILQEKRLERELFGLAVTPIQALVRRYLSNRRLHSTLERHEAAIKIQARFRQFHEQNTYKILLLEIVPAATIVQRHWKGYVQRRIFAMIIDATIRLQTFARRTNAMRKFQAWESSATCIQRVWRGFWAQLQYQMTLMDIIAIQCFVRKQQAIQFARKRSLAVGTLHRAGRVFALKSVVSRRSKERKAAHTLQNAFRMFEAIKVAAALREKAARLHAARVVQRSWRRFVFLRERQISSVKIQTQYRMWSLVTKYAKKRISACRIQSRWRLYTQRKAYLEVVRKAIILIQSRVRTWCASVVYSRLKSAAQVVQMYTRQWLAIRLMKAMKKERDDKVRAATHCQAVARRNSCLKSWKRTKLAIIALQCAWRRYWRRKLSKRKQELLSALSTCTLLCRYLRKGTFKITQQKRQVVPVRKQAIARCGAKQIFLSNSSTQVVPWHARRQKLFRHRSHVKAVRSKYRNGVSLNELPRRMITLRMLKSMSEAAMRLQAPWTYMYLHRCGVVGTGRRGQTRATAIKRSKRIRLLRAKQALLSSVRATVTRSLNVEKSSLSTSYQQDRRNIDSKLPILQRMLRSPRQRLLQSIATARILNFVHRKTDVSLGNKFAAELFEDPFKRKFEMNAASKVVQKYWRRFAATKQLRKNLQCIVTTQSAARRFLARRRAANIRAQICLIQSSVRSFLARQGITVLHRNATTIQRAWRRSSAQSKYQVLVVEYRKEVARNAAASTIQKRARGYMVRMELIVLNDCAVIIQRRARGCIARGKLEEAIKLIKDGIMAARIQHAWRGKSARLAFKKQIKNVILLQSAARRMFARKQLQQLLQEELEMIEVEAAIRIQASWRGFSNRAEFMFSLLAVIQIQSWWRCLSQQNAYGQLLMGLVSIQALVRGAQTRKLLELKQKSATVVQSAVRRMCAKRRLLRRKQQSCARTIQAFARVLLAKKWTSQQKVAVVCIQRSVRGFLARQNLSLQHFAATEIQRIWRGYEDAVGFIFVLVSIIKMQSFSRMALAIRLKQRLQLAKLKANVSATRIQALCRRMSAQKLASEADQTRRRRIKAAIKIQSVWRMTLAINRATFVARDILDEQERISSSASKIQSLARVVLAKKRRADLVKLREEERRIMLALKLQCFARVAMAQRKVAKLAQLQRITSPPKVDRSTVNPPTPEETMTKSPSVKALVAKLNNAKRGTQNETSKSADSSADAVLHRRLSISQGAIRGFLARRQSNPEVRKSIVLIREAELRSKLHPGMRLGARMEKALGVLKTSTSLTEIMNVVCTIELATRFSEECCAEFIEADATKILVGLMYGLNKSLPHVELLYYLMRTLMNICKHRAFVKYIASVDTAKAFLHLIRMYGSEDAVFCSAVSLLEICASENKEVRQLLATPASKRRMEDICKQWERKLDRRLALEAPSGGLSSPHRNKFLLPETVYTPQFINKRNKAKTDMLILGISYDLQGAVKTFRKVLVHSNLLPSSSRSTSSNNKKSSPTRMKHLPHHRIQI